MIKKYVHFIAFATSIFLLGCKTEKKEEVATETSKKPNIVVIYLDDLGYGDVSSYGATAFKTPNIDALANGGIKFTNGYASSATCTPSRYALLTGMYPWRNKKSKNFTRYSTFIN